MHKANTDPDTSHFRNPGFECCFLVRMRWVLRAAATDSRRLSEYPNGCGLFGIGSDGDEQTIHLGYKQRSSGAGNRGDTRDPPVRRIFRVQHIEEAGPATDVNVR